MPLCDRLLEVDYMVAMLLHDGLVDVQYTTAMPVYNRNPIPLGCDHGLLVLVPTYTVFCEMIIQHFACTMPASVHALCSRPW